jgi:hypothetical protein
VSRTSKDLRNVSPRVSEVRERMALTTHTNGFLGTPGAGGSQLGGSCSFGLLDDSEPATEATFGESTASIMSG